MRTTFCIHTLAQHTEGRKDARICPNLAVHRRVRLALQRNMNNEGLTNNHGVLWPAELADLGHHHIVCIKRLGPFRDALL